MSDLFGADPAASPLAVRMRPRTLDELVGQGHLLAPGSPLRRLAGGEGGAAGPVSVILWGPPGSGKTTLANVVSRAVGRRFVELSAVTAGVKDVRRVMEEARDARDLNQQVTVLFLDEIHRFSKAQQDALLPGVENRWVVLVAATTENPVVLGHLAAALPVAPADPPAALGRRRRRARRPRGDRRPRAWPAPSGSARTPGRTWSGSPAATPGGR